MKLLKCHHSSNLRGAIFALLRSIALHCQIPHLRQIGSEWVIPALPMQEKWQTCHSSKVVEFLQFMDALLLQFCRSIVAVAVLSELFRFSYFLPISRYFHAVSSCTSAYPEQTTWSSHSYQTAPATHPHSAICQIFRQQKNCNHYRFLNAHARHTCIQFTVFEWTKTSWCFQPVWNIWVK